MYDRVLKACGIWTRITEVFVNRDSALMYEPGIHSTIILLPLEGACSMSCGQVSIGFSHHEIGVVQTVNAEKWTVETNAEGHCRMLLVQLSVGMPQDMGVKKYSFRLDRANELVRLRIPELDAFSGWIGIFEGRKEFEVSGVGPHLYCSIHGAFEANGVLIESRDVLCLNDAHNVEIESLSEYAIMLCLSYT